MRYLSLFLLLGTAGCGGLSLDGTWRTVAGAPASLEVHDVPTDQWDPTIAHAFTLDRSVEVATREFPGCLDRVVSSGRVVYDPDGRTLHFTSYTYERHGVGCGPNAPFFQRSAILPETDAWSYRFVGGELVLVDPLGTHAWSLRSGR